MEITVNRDASAISDDDLVVTCNRGNVVSALLSIISIRFPEVDKGKLLAAEVWSFAIKMLTEVLKDLSQAIEDPTANASILPGFILGSGIHELEDGTRIKDLYEKYQKEMN